MLPLLFRFAALRLMPDYAAAAIDAATISLLPIIFFLFRHVIFAAAADVDC